MAQRGVLYVVWGEAVEPLLQRSMDSVRNLHPELPIHVHRLPPDSTLLDKAALYDASPFEETLFLDADTVVLGRLDFGFAKAAQFGLALCVNENPWARRYAGLDGDLVEYNTGVMFFTAQARPVFDAWKACVRQVDSSHFFYARKQLMRMPENDQAGFALAMEQTGFCPFVLPLNWNFRPKWYYSVFGPVRIWHDHNDVPPQLLGWNARQNSPQAVIEFALMHDVGDAGDTGGG